MDSDADIGIYERKSEGAVLVENHHISLTLAGLDSEQVDFMNREHCIRVNYKDEVLSDFSKKSAHLLSNIKKGYLHRAFSVFLFNSKKELLLQKRSKYKITFPNYLTNTCCSHPLSNPYEIPEDDNYIGARRAARRKLTHELGIPSEQLPLEKFIPMRKVHYMSPCDDGIWGEHEVDLILIFCGDVTLNLNYNEVSETRYVSHEYVTNIVANNGNISNFQEKLTPWFKLIVNNYLNEWWENLDNIKLYSNPNKIDDYCKCNST